MKNINYIIGNENIVKIPMQTFNDEICSFLNDFSSQIFKSRESRLYPDISSVAFWSRKSNIQKLKANFNVDKRLGKGLCFHITPSNIPVNSFFSYFFALLAGNANIVRLPSKDFPQVNILCNICNEVIKKYPAIEKRTAFVRYDRTTEASENFSSIADCRMIWGGDKTIENIKSFKTKPRCLDITFSDRYSICIIDAKAINEANEDEIKRLSENFYNDTYLMDQNACSSPKIICWLNDSQNAREKFWNYVYDFASYRYNFQDAVCIDKYTKLCEDSIDFDDILSVKTKTNLLYRVELKELNNSVVNKRGYGGYFYEYPINKIDEILLVVDERFQTVTYFGINPELLKEYIIKMSVMGIDRIVPIGKAMDIQPYWDGHDIVRELSREIIAV